MKNTMILAVTAVALLGLSCKSGGQQESEALKVLQGKVDQCERDLSRVNSDLVTSQDELEKAEINCGFEKQHICDHFEEVSKSVLTPSVMSLELEGHPQLTSCHDNVSVVLRKVETDSAWLKYTVGTETRYSDELVWRGEKADRSSILIHDGLEAPLLLTIESCTGDTCNLACVRLDTTGLSCTNPEIGTE